VLFFSKYTDLTTFESGNDGGENIGITNIDIDFNSQQEPIRLVLLMLGSAIQNEDNILNGSNKFSTFFQLHLSYSCINWLKVLWSTVKYCLHMIKF
jgi:hypothetical protein